MIDQSLDSLPDVGNKNWNVEQDHSYCIRTDIKQFESESKDRKVFRSVDLSIFVIDSKPESNSKMPTTNEMAKIESFDFCMSFSMDTAM